MSVTKASCILAMAGLLTFASAASADEEVDYQYRITATSSYSADSPAADKVQAWLRQNAAYVDGGMIGNPAQLGDVRVRITSTPSDLQAAGVGDGPMPATGDAGDIISITSVAATATQSWTYQWKTSGSVGSWKLISYAYEERGGGVPVTSLP